MGIFLDDCNEDDDDEEPDAPANRDESERGNEDDVDDEDGNEAPRD